MAQSIIRDLFFFAIHFEGFTKNYPFLFEGLQNILKGIWRAGPQNKGNSPSILFHDSNRVDVCKLEVTIHNLNFKR